MPESLELPISYENKKPLKEGREAIGRFLGKNSFNNLTMFEILRILVDKTNNQGKNSFQINLDDNPVVDLVEKVDSTFCNFGIDRNR